MTTSTLREVIWQLVASVPPGSVATYGQIARLAGYPSHARYVGTTLKNLPKGTTLPWFRIINGRGEISFPPDSPSYRKQVVLLEDEGIEIEGGRVRLAEYQWKPG